MARPQPFLPLFDPSPEPPQPATPSTPDAAARAHALDIRRSFIVEAPAGSGKTGLLIQRFLKLLADPAVTQPEQVLAITFTNKAAAEMRDRVLSHLEAARTETSSPETDSFLHQTRLLAHAVLTRDHTLDWQLLDHPNRLNLRTIDSVSAEIARSLPVLSGSGGQLSPTLEASSLYREAARRTLLLLGAPHTDPTLNNAIRDLLLHRDGNLADCETLLADMLGLRDQWATLIPLTHPHLDDGWLNANVLPRLERTLALAIGQELDTLANAFPSDILAGLAELAAELALLNGYKGNLNPIAHCSGAIDPPETGAQFLDHWKAFNHLTITPSSSKWRDGLNNNHLGIEFEKHHKARLKALIDRIRHRDDLRVALCRIRSLPRAQYPANQWAVAKSLFRVLSRALVELQLVFAERAQCDFTEVSLLARTALNAPHGPEDLAAALGARLQHLLVDEMQDTSAGQYELIHLLTHTWDGHSQTVFLVGDPRQSIYLFRLARVESFLQTLQAQRLGDLPLTRLRLTANFRSQQTLVANFNRDFALLFPPGDPLPYTSADATLPPSLDTASLTWHTNPVAISPADLPPDLTAPQVRQRQARRDAKEIRRIARTWLTKPLPFKRTAPWRIAVLVRNRNHLIEIVEALKLSETSANPVPYRAVEIEALADRQEILDLTALTRALLHPADRVAWLAILRAPWCGLPLAHLHILTGSDDANLRYLPIPQLIAQHGDLLSEDSIQRLTRLWTVLEAASTQRSRLSTSALVERAWRSLGGDASLTPAELTNCRRYFQLLDELESVGTQLDTTLLETRLRRLYAEPNTVPSGNPFVELLTIHSAKGLEWDVVFVPALERSPGRSFSRLLTWSELPISDPDSDAPHVLLAPIAARGEEIDELTAWLKSIHREREMAEYKRLFYVAATRAREELHLFAAPDLTSKGKLNPRRDSLLKSAWPAAEPHFAGAPSQTASSSEMGLRTSLQESTNPPAPADPDLPDLDSEAWVPDFEIPIPPELPQPLTFDLAAAAPAPTLLRLPASFSPEARFTAARSNKLPYAEPEIASPTEFARPEGGFQSRVFGTAVHAFLELLAKRLATGTTPQTLLAELPSWTPRIAATLRARGLPPATIPQLAGRVRSALEATLRDPNGLWLLSPRPNAATEFSLTAAAPALSSIRIDRLFHAGPSPQSPGEDTLWIVDYKTATHAQKGLDEFLATQRATYAPQLETYARILTQASPTTAVRLALYYPTLPHLLWWDPAKGA